MRLVREKEKEARKVQFGREDWLLVFVVALIIAGLVRGQLTFEQALAYIDVSTRAESGAC